jgi:hypothetical protein|uniref:Uncharacterized protein n=1 Tax=Myoviridae sp. ctegP15 TaxID=2825146 RepID=A0A8S5P391_9CAUD|nr:MAG TPA: hypothetical protein [Myoviridae sp. ctegP15]
MEMKWHPIEDGNLKGIPRDEEVIFTVLDEDTGEVRTAAGKVDEYFLKKRGHVFVGAPKYPVDVKTLKAWAELPEPFHPNDCNRCAHSKEWTDEFGDRWWKCELWNEPFAMSDCPLR